MGLDPDTLGFGLLVLGLGGLIVALLWNHDPDADPPCNCGRGDCGDCNPF